MIDAVEGQAVDLSRRRFCLTFTASALLLECWLGLGEAWARAAIARANKQVPFLDHDEAVAEGTRRGIGQVDVLAPAPDRSVVAAGMTSFQFRYVTGETAIQPGGFVWFAMRHVFQASNPQTRDPLMPGYVTVKGPQGVGLELVCWPDRADSADLFLRAFPWQHPIEVRVTSGRLNPGDAFEVTYGDRSGGGPGVKMQPSQEAGFAFRIYVAPSPDDPLMPLANDIVFPIVGGPVERLVLLAASDVDPARPVRLLLRAEDKYGNEAVSYTAEVLLRADDGRELARLSMTPDHRGVLRTEIAPFRPDGVLRFEVADGTFTARSNPVEVGPSGSRIYFGDIHGHSLWSDGRGTPEEFYRYARNIAGLDFCALTDHDFMMTDKMWETNQAATEAAHDPGRFVTLHAYEWSGMTDVGGDHNVYFRGPETMLLRCRSYYDYRNQQAYHGADPQANHIEDLHDALLANFEEGKVMTIPHFGGRPANPAWHNPRIQRMIEIFSDHQRSHAWAYKFFERGYRIGIIACSDNHTGRPGNGFLNNPFSLSKPIEIGTGLVGMRTKELSREVIFDGIFNRHAYATSGDRILLDVEFGHAGMGDEVASGTIPVLRSRIEGTAPVTAVEVWKNVVSVHTMRANSESVVMEWTDPQPPAAGETASYWIRVLQSNGEEAISSPIWWTRA